MGRVSKINGNIILEHSLKCHSYGASFFLSTLFYEHIATLWQFMESLPPINLSLVELTPAEIAFKQLSVMFIAIKSSKY